MARTPEGRFQDRVVKDLESLGALVLKNDATYRQGIPDLTAFMVGGEAIVIELKKAPPSKSDYRPNQEWYLGELEVMGFRTFVVYPENWDEVFHAIR